MNPMAPPAHRPPAARALTRTRAVRTVFAAITLVGVVALPTAASAATAEPSAAAADELPARLERACLRIPNLQIRTDRLLDRIQADADTIGSLAWLEVQIERAGAAGREQLVTVLENRLAVRRATIDVLEQRAGQLERLAERCRELGVDL